MKTFTLLTFFLLFHFNLISQTWFENNDVWYWGNTSFFVPPFLSTNKTFVDGDTIIENQTYKVLRNIRQTRNTFTQDTTYSQSIYGFVYQEADKVFWRTSQGEDELFYDFNLEIGDTMSHPAACYGINMILENIGYEDINGIQVRYQDFHVESLGQLDVFEDSIRIHEGLGLIFGPYNTGYYGFDLNFNIDCVIVDPPSEFFCYSNDFFEYTTGLGECYDFEGLITSINPPRIGGEIKVYPNPCTDEIRLSSDGMIDEFSVKIIRPDGKVIKEIKNINDHLIDMSGLNEGIYLLVLHSQDSFLGIEKVVKLVN